MARDCVLGIAVEDEHARYATFEVHGMRHVLLHVDEHPRDNDSPGWFLRRISEPKDKHYRHVSEVSVALGLSSTIMHVFPLDASLSQSERNDHIHWELSSYIPEYDPKQYVVDWRILRPASQDQVADLLVVAVNRSLVLEIQKFINDQQLRIGTIDTSYFASEFSFQVNYAERKTKSVILIVLHRTHAEIGWEANGKLVHFELVRETSPSKIVQRIRRHLPDYPVSEVYCCGEISNTEDVKTFQYELGLPALVVNPFNRLVKRSLWKTSQSLRGSEFVLNSCAGIALQPQ
ncbi:MAG TPA: pilus assembly protein PilM [Bacteroidota bacterium]|nr:pilus assembly protein PilM [Bacteroidota bacterium]